MADIDITTQNRTEEWHDIPGYEGLYQASSSGRVRSLPRSTTLGKILTPHVNNSGYMRVSVTVNGNSKYLYVHHLVALVFVGARPAGHDVNHINGIKTDNRSENLEYMTRAENMKHARALGLHNNRADGHYNAKLNSNLVHDIRRAFETCGVDETEIAPSLGLSIRTVRDVLERKTWRDVP